MRSIGWSVFIALLAIPLSAASEPVDTTAVEGDYIDLTTGLVYRYDPSRDVVFPKLYLDHYATFVKVQPVACGDHDVCVIVSTAVRGNVQVDWIVEPRHDAGESPQASQHGPFVSPNTDQVTFVAGASTDDYDQAGWARVTLRLDGVHWETKTVRY